ncbi:MULTISPECIES: hypothetical protein [unclassified Streptomyces]|uniref:hypothetical protein n=1 Tax=unclassified Streptomyces TaxID=2593676 RepID=UPI002DD9C41B|nr:hypothetical protein [Streptomyces sp. NBC_01795]WSA93748.1 hypothetical protein OIE63_20790 [Streptomyces sp. NBC_01795]WSS42425.1 hypothetical protein OG220_18965 [Streptomyces sp. NBC_01187]
MTAVIAAMITAIVGVLGTLFAPLISHRMATRQRAEDREETERIRLFEERRAAYTAMNRASRRFSTLLKDALHRLRDGVYADQERTALEEARLDYRERYAEAQMIVPERILEASRAVNQVLAKVDATVKRLDRNLARDGEDADSVRRTLTADGDPLLAAMRQLMREDLGIQD